MAQICLDLGVAATLLGCESQAVSLGLIFEWLPTLHARLVVPRTQDDAAEAAAMPPVVVPGTG